MKTRKRSTIRKHRQIILKTANSLEKQGIDCTHRGIFVGEKRPIKVQTFRKQEKN